MKNSPVTNFLTSLFKYRKTRILSALLLMLVVGLTEGISLVMLIPLLGLIGMAEQAQQSSWVTDFFQQLFLYAGVPYQLSIILVLFTVFIGIQAYTRHRTNVLVSEITFGFADHLRQRLFTAMSQTDWLFFSRQRSSDFTHILTADLDRVGQGTYFALRLGIVSVIAVFYIAVSLTLSPLVTTVTLLIGLLLLFILHPFHKKAARLGSSLTNNMRELYNMISEKTSGMKLARIYGKEKNHSDDFTKQTNKLQSEYIEFQRDNSATRMWFKLGSAVALSIIVYFSVESTAIATAELLVLIIIFTRLMLLLTEIQQNYQQCNHMLPAFQAAQELYCSCLSKKEQKRESNLELSDLNSEIHLSNICFHYHAQLPVLKNINFVIPAFSTIALVGQSGAGKSTLADCLMGLIEPVKGELLVDGVKISKQLRPAWRRSIAYVSQDTFLFNQSIRNNLLWACPEANENEIWHVLESASADKFVQSLPEGLDTKVGERGLCLSGGERQRIAIARALITKPELLILDEATSAVDVGHEQQIQKAINKLHGKLTIIIIAHRLSTVRQADQIVVLDSGKITGIGDWEELLKKNNKYIGMLLDSQDQNKTSNISTLTDFKKRVPIN